MDSTNTTTRTSRDCIEGLGERLRALRTSRKWSLRQASARCRIDFAKLSNIENSTHRGGLTARTLVSIAIGLGCSADYLCGLSRTPDAWSDGPEPVPASSAPKRSKAKKG